MENLIRIDHYKKIEAKNASIFFISFNIKFIEILQKVKK